LNAEESEAHVEQLWPAESWPRHDGRVKETLYRLNIAAKMRDRPP
jgi:hypothetical protein